MTGLFTPVFLARQGKLCHLRRVFVPKTNALSNRTTMPRRVVIFLIALFAAATPLRSQTLTTLHHFNNDLTGSYPESDLLLVSNTLFATALGRRPGRGWRGD